MDEYRNVCLAEREMADFPLHQDMKNDHFLKNRLLSNQIISINHRILAVGGDLIGKIKPS